MSSQSPERYFPQKLQSMRERRRLSRQMLADLCGLSRNVIAQYERGKGFPSIGNLIVLAEFFDTSIDELCVHRAKKRCYAEIKGRPSPSFEPPGTEAALISDSMMFGALG